MILSNLNNCVHVVNLLLLSVPGNIQMKLIIALIKLHAFIYYKVYCGRSYVAAAFYWTVTDQRDQ